MIPNDGLGPNQPLKREGRADLRFHERPLSEKSKQRLGQSRLPGAGHTDVEMIEAFASAGLEESVHGPAVPEAVDAIVSKNVFEAWHAVSRARALLGRACPEQVHVRHPLTC